MNWRIAYSETCLKASAKDVDSQKTDDELHELFVYEFKLTHTEIYTMEIPLPKTWKDMVKAHETVIGLLNYE
ncbi:2086_t:CDS:2, partial [Scutellospora calospora]